MVVPISVRRCGSDAASAPAFAAVWAAATADALSDGDPIEGVLGRYRIAWLFCGAASGVGMSDTATGLGAAWGAFAQSGSNSARLASTSGSSFTFRSALE